MGKKLDIKKLQTERSAGFISTEEALKDVTPFEWPDEVVSSVEGDDKATGEMDWGPDVGGEILSLYDSD